MQLSCSFFWLIVTLPCSYRITCYYQGTKETSFIPFTFQQTNMNMQPGGQYSYNNGGNMLAGQYSNGGTRLAGSQYNPSVNYWQMGQYNVGGMNMLGV